ncbi:C45 family autoproteolytic acyltransferase/hydrolase (plasmid) [Rhizobium sp. CB3171]|uniref:C45 family autoproteolytic acyltransferase/hydolase n=1 Tax=Rhizobium sp. CB3171 TaxID=3039157 RepID=UPI0024B0AC4F|nr:C45 family peptidase [Rhizobium sp. CB3171]WFU06727.1 C45 family autoproteolytic acyltransferase/hydrolase [Rhizobium sp. CB3171]
MANNPISPVRAKGDAFTIGIVLGRASASAFRERVLYTEEYRALDTRWRRSGYLKALEAAARATYPRFVREIEGIAEGAGQDFDSIFLWNCRGDLRLPEDVSPATRAVAANGCTTLLLPAQGDSPAMIAHNEDGDQALLGACFWVEVEPDEGPAWASFMYPGMLPGHTFGVNEMGLVQTINNITAHDLQPGVPRHIICRAILDSRTLDDAAEILKRKDRASGFHHNLGEAKTRRLVSIEAPASGCAIREAVSPQGHANHLIFEDFAQLEQTISASSRDRQAAVDRVTAGQRLGQDAEVVLFDETVPIYKNGTIDRSQTLAMGVFALLVDRVEWSVHGAHNERDVLGGTVLVK